ncbi:hypothetical protein [Mycoplasmopsis columbina]|uniref:hypothetical protein n=1 Tax=Mycoplasmopsis columbina TaxID=114881 RepID=UPI0004A6F32D|nr:hypothetical protein [Mycoplasmopsis columbina]
MILLEKKINKFRKKDFFEKIKYDKKSNIFDKESKWLIVLDLSECSFKNRKKFKETIADFFEEKEIYFCFYE